MSTKPAFQTSDVVAQLLAAALWDYAARLEADGAAHNPNTASLARLVRRSARDLLDMHDIKHDEVLIDAPRPSPEQGYQ